MTQAAPGSGAGGTTRPRRTPVADLFEETFRIYRRNLGVMVLLSAAFGIPIVLANLPLLVLQAEWYRGPLLAPAQRVAAFLENLWPLVGLSLLYALVAAVLGTFGAAGITYVAGRARSEEGTSFEAALRALRGLAPSILGFVALVLAGTLVLIIGLVLVVVFGTMLDVMFGSRGATLLVIVFVFAAVIAFFVTFARLALSIPALVLEDLSPLRALQRSWRLVEGSTWRTFGILLLGFFAISVVASLAAPFYVPVMFQGLFSGSVGSLVLVTLISAAIQSILAPIVPTLLTVLYFDYVANRP
jgi:hypothetical protein